ncbi:MAG TPA: metallophosphoesterase [Acidobacteriaceae bacterium]|jgi:predicted MPP superfamily phosphohydrolase|nr:metallophosphoesterase [Acidobacteriaceae bacterium]
MPGYVADHTPVEQKTLLTRRKFLLGSAAAASGLALYSGEHARHEISVVTQDMALAKLPDAFLNYRIAQISDIHFDEYTEAWFVRRVVEQVNRLAPDLVLLTGDYISNTPMGPNFAAGAMLRCAKELSALTCPARYAVMGNHDSFLGPPLIRAGLASASIPMLFNQHVAIERNGQHLWLAGLADALSNVPNLQQAIPAIPDGPVILLCHEPDYADNVLDQGYGALVDVMLSGHSHGGQVRLPLIGPLKLPYGGQKYSLGLYQLGQMQLYVNRGIGTVGVPFRLNCPPEITLFTLTRS